MVLTHVKATGAQTCVPQNEFIALDSALVGIDDHNQVALGSYERISPDGRFVLRSYSGKNLTTVTLIELPPPGRIQPVRLFQTPLSNEAFPVQGSWRYLVDIDGTHFLFKDVLTQQTRAQARFKAGMTGFYAAAAQVSDNQGFLPTNQVQIRSLSWPNANAHGDAQGQGTLTSRTITVDIQRHVLVADSGVQHLCAERANVDGAMYALPMLSVDGQEFSALPQMPAQGPSTMHIFGFGAKGDACIAKAQLDVASGKFTFGFGQNQDPDSRVRHSDVVYEYRNQVWWVPQDSNIPLNLAPWDDNGKAPIRDVQAGAFPGMTRDGRVIYAATWQQCNEGVCRKQGGYVVSDPTQSNAYLRQVQDHIMGARRGSQRARSCVTVQQVTKERAQMARFHGIAE